MKPEIPGKIEAARPLFGGGVSVQLTKDVRSRFEHYYYFMQHVDFPITGYRGFGEFLNILEWLGNMC